MEEAEFAWESERRNPKSRGTPPDRFPSDCANVRKNATCDTSPYGRNSYGLVSFLRGKKLTRRTSLAEREFAMQESTDRNVANRPQFENTNKWNTRTLVTMALLCAISVLLSFIELPLIPGVAFLKYDPSNVPALISGFAYGPAGGLAVGPVSAIIHGIMLADPIGAAMNILVIVGFVLPASIIYAKSRTWKSAVIGLILSAIVATAMALVGNLLLTPIYMGVPVQTVIDMLVPALLPFNLVKSILNAVLTLVVYKGVSNLITPKKKQVKGR